MADAPDPNKLRGLGVTLIVVGVATGLVFVHLERCTNEHQTVAARC